jgi:methyl-accepting chemotaxis protein
LSAPRSAPAQVARLQAAQIESTRSAFEGAVAGIREGLARIEKDVTGMMREVEHLLGVSGREGDSFFAALEADFALILKILESNAAGDRDLAETGSSLGETISQMSASAGSIQQIGHRMQLLALNAAIEAVRLGDTGTALATLADAIRTLAQESDERAAEMAGRVDAMRAASAGLQHLAGNCAASDHQITDLRRSVEELHSVQQETRQRCAAAAALAEQLAASICQTIQAFGGQEAVPQALRRASHALTELADESRPSSRAGGLEELAARYTMHSERAVHTAVTGGVAPVAVEAGPSDLGDNVELF